MYINITHVYLHVYEYLMEYTKWSHELKEQSSSLELLNTNWEA